MYDNFEEENDFVEFFDIQNLYFDHPLSIQELEELKTVVLGYNNLNQIYFKGTCDLISIERVKNLLLISSTTDDSKIEKIVTCNLNDSDYSNLINSNFENPSTWSVSYYNDGNNYMVDTIPKVREFDSYVEKIKNLVIKEELTPLERVFRIYDIVKLIEFDNSLTDDSLSTIVNTNKSNVDGYNKLFSYLLNKINIPNYLGIIENSDKEKNLITLVLINDEKYNISGLFLFNPAYDSLDKNTYKEDIRMISYNYFGLKLEDIEYSNYKDSLKDTLGILAINKYDYAIDRLANTKNIHINREFNKMYTIFNNNFKYLYDSSHNEMVIDENIIEKLCDNVYEGTIMENFSSIVKKNYLDRKKELFSDNPHKKLKEMLKGKR